MGLRPKHADLVAPALRDATLSPRLAGPSPRSWPGSAPSAPPTSSWGSWPAAGTSWSKPLVDALSKVRAERPEVRFRKKDVRPEVLHLLRRCCDLVLEPSGAGESAEAALSLRLKRAFDLLTLLHPADDVVRAYQNLRQGTPKAIDYALEHLDNLLDRELKALLFPLIEDLPAAERAARLRRTLRLKCPSRR